MSSLQLRRTMRGMCTICTSSGRKTGTDFTSAWPKNGIQTAVHYPRPVHLQQAYDHLGYHEGLFLCRKETPARCFHCRYRRSRVKTKLSQWPKPSNCWSKSDRGNPEYKIMYDMEMDYWWYVGLHHLVLHFLGQENHRGGDPLQILDAGCGTGQLMKLSTQQGSNLWAWTFPLKLSVSL